MACTMSAASVARVGVAMQLIESLSQTVNGWPARSVSAIDATR